MSTKITYSLRYIKDSNVIEIQDSNITMRAHIQKYATQRLNVANIEIMGLKKESREFIYKDRYAQINQPSLVLEAGLDGNNAVVFSGTVLEAYSSKEKAEIKTNITAQDGQDLVGGSIINTTFGSGKSMRDIMMSTINYTGLTPGYIGSFDETQLLRDIPVNGNTYEELQSLSNNTMFIDNGTINKLDDNEVINEILVLTSNNRFLKTPQRIGQYLVLEILFLPLVKVGQLVEVKSDYERAYNGLYKLVGIDHQISASGSVLEQSRTRLELFIPDGKQFIYVNK